MAHINHPTHLGHPSLIGACQLVDEAFAALLYMVGWRGAPYAATACKTYVLVLGLLCLFAQLLACNCALLGIGEYERQVKSHLRIIVNIIVLDLLKIDPDPLREYWLHLPE